MSAEDQKWGKVEKRQQTADQAKHVVISLAAMIVMCFVVYIFNIPNPNMILITGLTVFTTLYGYPSGIACGVAMLISSLFFFSTDHDMITFTSMNLQKMSVIILGVIMNVVFIGNLKKRYLAAQEKLLEINRLLRTDNKALEEASMVDALTGTLNRYALSRDYSNFEGRSVHVMMLDLDNFKQINDRFGHAVGDYALKKVGEALTDVFGMSACYRYGGDEFLVICAGLSEDMFREKLDALRRAIEKVHLEQDNIPLHFSAGYVYGDCDLSYDLRVMMHHADSVLYEAKKVGKAQYKGAAYSRSFAESIEKDFKAEGKRYSD